MNKKVVFSVMLVGILALGLGFISCGNNSLNGKWIAEGYENMGITFSGNKFTLTTNPTAEMNMFGTIYQAQDGTYSITDDRIEFKFSDGRIEVERFTRTENTLTVRGRRLFKN